MQARIRVNRKAELALISDMVSGATQERVLLVQSGTGMGKSELLREVASRLPRDGLYAVIDFKGGHISDLTELLSRLCGRLGWARFQGLASQLGVFIHPTATVSHNTIIGRADIFIALTTPDDLERSLRRAALTDAFLKDLEACGPVVLVFDTYNACDSQLARWMSGFLARACGMANLTVIVAGQSVPEPTLDWEERHIPMPLRPMAPEHWLEYSKALGLEVEIEYVRGLWFACDGHSLRMAELFETMLTRLPS